MNDTFERNHPMKDDKEFITSYWADRAHDFGADKRNWKVPN